MTISLLEKLVSLYSFVKRVCGLTKSLSSDIDRKVDPSGQPQPPNSLPDKTLSLDKLEKLEADVAFIVDELRALSHQLANEKAYAGHRLGVLESTLYSLPLERLLGDSLHPQSRLELVDVSKPAPPPSLG